MKSISFSYVKLGDAPLPPNCFLKVHPFPFAQSITMPSVSKDIQIVQNRTSQPKRVAVIPTEVFDGQKRAPTNGFAP